MSQTSYTTDPSNAIAGMLADGSEHDIVSYPAAEEIPPGRQCVLNSDGKLELPQDTSFAKPVGVSCYKSSAPTGPYPAGAMVPCVRRGRVWAETTGSAPGELVDANVNHSSTTATHRGKFTTSAVSGSAGSEISDPGPACFVEAGATGLAKVEVNFPGSGAADDDARLDVLEAATAGLGDGAAGAFSAGDWAPVALVHNAVYPVPATSANSTITLPAAAVDGTKAYFIADGAANGHTVQYRDATGTVALTTALTASKRHMVTVIKEGAAWYASAYTSP